MPSLPWVRFYAAKWLSSDTRLLMNTSQRAIYLDLLWYCYERGGGIPADIKHLAVLAAVSPEEFNAAWPVVSKNFAPCTSDPKSLSNPVMLEAIRETGRKQRPEDSEGKHVLGSTCQTEQRRTDQSRAEQIRTEQRRTEEIESETETENETESELEVLLVFG